MSVTGTVHRQRWWPRLAPWIATPALLGLLLPLQRAWIPGSGPLAWALDLFSNWQPWYAAAWLCACLLGASGNRRWLLGLPLVLLPFVTSSRMAPRMDGPADIVVAVANVNIRNSNPSALLAWLEQRPANLVVLSELSPAYAETLQSQIPEHLRYHALHPLISPPGIGLLSDRPLHNVRVVPDGLGALRLEADIKVNDVDVRFIAIHPKPPLATRKHVARDKLIRNLSDATRGMPTIVAGDANATPWSSALLGPHSRDLARITGLAPTYPTEGGGILGVSIDHVLVSPHFAMVQTERGPDIGSDHLPVRGELRLMDK